MNGDGDQNRGTLIREAASVARARLVVPRRRHSLAGGGSAAMRGRAHSWTAGPAPRPPGRTGNVPSRVSATSGSEQARGRKGGEDGTDLLAACAPALAPREESIGLAGWCAADVPLKKVAAPTKRSPAGQEAGRIAGRRGCFGGAEEEHGSEAVGPRVLELGLPRRSSSVSGNGIRVSEATRVEPGFLLGENY